MSDLGSDEGSTATTDIIMVRMDPCKVSVHTCCVWKEPQVDNNGKLEKKLDSLRNEMDSLKNEVRGIEVKSVNAWNLK